MKNILLFSAFLAFQSPLYAEDCVNCDTKLSAQSDLEKKLLELKAPMVVNCEDHLKNEVENEYNANFANQPKKTATIKGLKLSGSSDEINFVTKMIGEKPPVDKWADAKSCSDVLCALTKVYDSKEAAQRALNIAKRHGYIASIAKDFTDDTTKPIGQTFSLAELQIIDMAYKQLPPTYKKLRSMDRLKRMPNGYSSPRSPNAAAYARPGFKSSYFSTEGEIVFIQSAFSDDKTWGTLVAIHELSHHMDFSKSDKVSFGLSEVPAFMKLSGWKKSVSYKTDDKGKKVQEEEWTHDKGKKFVTDYAATQPAEDLADSAAYYILEPRKLKRIDPEKYNYIKNNLFGGKEYLNEPDLQVDNEELLAECMKDTKDLTLYGRNQYVPKISPSCFDNYIKNFEITDPKLCNYSKDQLKTYLYDKVSTNLDGINASLEICSQDLESHKNSCSNANDYRKSCAVEKCELNPLVKAKVRTMDYSDNSNKAMQALQRKVGLPKMATSLLTSALSEKMGVSYSFNLNKHKEFIDRAVPQFLKMLDESGFKFDDSMNLTNAAQYFIMTDKELTKSLDSFQQEVLKVSDRNKEKNLELVKAWAKTQSIEDPADIEALTEAVTLQKKGWFSK